MDCATGFIWKGMSVCDVKEGGACAVRLASLPIHFSPFFPN